MRPAIITFISILAAALQLPSFGGEAETRPLFAFDSGTLEPVASEGGSLTIVDGGASGSAKSLRATPVENGKKWLIKFPLPDGLDLSEFQSLKASLRVDADGGAKLRWYAVDSGPGGRRVAFQRVVNLPAGKEWTALDWPLETWRWGEGLTGHWPEADALYLVAESPLRQLEVDEIALVKGTRGKQSACVSREKALSLAFAGAEFKSKSDAGLLVATDSLGFFNDDDLAAMLRNASAAQKWLRETFGDAYTPTNDGLPACLFIFEKKEGQVNFLNRLSDFWGASIAPSTSDGYTLATFATVVHLANRGKDRPVFLHEFVHAMVSRDLRLPVGAPKVSWLQEGLANYIQVCVYPSSVDRNIFVKNFAKPIDAQSFFRPLNALFTGPVTTSNYAQLASLTAFLAKNDAALLRALASGLARGESVEQILKRQNSSVEALQERWLEWGRKTYAKTEADGTAAFEALPGFKTE